MSAVATEIILPVPHTTVGQSFHVNASINEKVEVFGVELIDLRSTEIYLRFKADFNERVVERNAALEILAGWGKPDTSEGFPFEAPMDFDLVINVETPHFNILINDNTFCIFRHQSAFTNINAIRVYGDIKVNYIEVLGFQQGLVPQGSVGTLFSSALKRQIAKYPPITDQAPVIEPDTGVSSSAENQPTGPGPPYATHKSESMTNILTSTNAALQDPSASGSKVTIDKTMTVISTKANSSKAKINVVHTPSVQRSTSKILLAAQTSGKGASAKSSRTSAGETQNKGGCCDLM